jgi:UDP-N-acetylmuramoylalanine--D-glutamate ligase
MDVTRLRRVLIVGLGRSGLAAARLAARSGARVRVTDRRPASELADQANRLPDGCDTFFGGHPDRCLDDVDLVVASPGVAPDSDILRASRRRGLAIVTELEFAWLHVPGRPTAAVTGSNGKSTVTTLIAEILRDSGLAAAAGGNLGPAASELVLEGGWDCWALEVSSFQSELLTAMRPSAAVFLNLSQDHLERHPDMASYRDAKRRLFLFQEPDDLAVLNADEPDVVATPTRARRRTFSLSTAADAWLDDDRLVLGGEVLVDRSRVALAGVHNVANALASVLAAVELGASLAAARRVLRRFRGLAHRHQIVHESGGVRWVDDSKATNVGATLAALAGYPAQSLHLILGGQAKGQDFGVMAREVGRVAARVYVIGVDGPEIARSLAGAAPIEVCGDLEEAVRAARAAAAPGQLVLLAPACASFDQFEGYAHRGRVFADLAGQEVAPCP